MNRRDIKNKNKIADSDVGTENELQPLQGFAEGGFNSNGINKFENSNGRPPRDRNVASCSQKKALIVTGAVLAVLVGIALLIAYAGPTDCPCARSLLKGYNHDGTNGSEKFEPYATNGQPFPWLLPFLPSNIRPNRYTILIHPNLTTFEVKGQVSIEFFVEKEMSFIVLHAQNLNITEKALVGPKGFQLKINKILEYPQRQQIYIEFRDKLRKKSNYSLNLRWYSKLSSDPEGFYVDEYEVNGAKKLLAATVLGPGKARRAFPCFDEPHLRANFKISIFRDRFHIGLSNSIVHATDDVGLYMGKSMLRDDFVETPPLSPDAISWMISVFKREFLESSATYQTTTTTTPMPSQSLTTASKITGSLIKNDKILRANMSQIFKTGLIKSFANLEKEDNTPPPHVTQRTENQIKEDNQVTMSVDGVIRTAPSYTFYAPEDILPKTKFILHTSRDILEHLQMWLNVPYPFTKLDFVALPSIEENLQSSLGLISVKISFLRDANTVTSYENQNSAVELSEAILKQYFGGLISPKTWKQNWLWDGTIRYLSRLMLTPLQPMWQIDEKYLLENKLRALDIDVLQGWDSVLNGTDDMGENSEFYIDKSAAVLEVLHSALGEENFRLCMGSFITAHKYSTAEPNDLWNTCSKKANKNIRDMMHLWTVQSGFPLVVVTRTNMTVSINQKPFKLAEFVAVHEDPSFDDNTTETTTMSTTTTTLSPKEAKKRATKWTFPIQYITSNKDLKDIVWIDSVETKINLKENVKWIKLNAEQKGYYRVLYDIDNWNAIINQLRLDHTAFTPNDRMGLISDAFALCHGNLLDCSVALNLTSYLSKEKNWGPMMVALKHFESWRKILKYTECYLLLTEYMRSNLAKSIAQIGWKDTGDEELRLLRPQVLLAAVLWEHPEAIEEAKKTLRSHLFNATSIAPNLREVTYVGAVLSSDIVYWQHCFFRYSELRKDKDNLDERIELLRALGMTKDAWLQNRLMTYVMTLPTVEITPTLEAIASTPTGGAMACRFLQAKWFDLQKRFKKGSVNFAKVISSITKYGANKFDYDELKSLVDRFGDGPGMQLLQMNLRTVAANVEWISQAHSSIMSWVDAAYSQI